MYSLLTCSGGLNSNPYVISCWSSKTKSGSGHSDDDVMTIVLLYRSLHGAAPLTANLLIVLAISKAISS